MRPTQVHSGVDAQVDQLRDFDVFGVNDDGTWHQGFGTHRRAKPFDERLELVTFPLELVDGVAFDRFYRDYRRASHSGTGRTHDQAEQLV